MIAAMPKPQRLCLAELLPDGRCQVGHGAGDVGHEEGQERRQAARAQPRQQHIPQELPHRAAHSLVCVCRALRQLLHNNPGLQQEQPLTIHRMGRMLPGAKCAHRAERGTQKIRWEGKTRHRDKGLPGW